MTNEEKDEMAKMRAALLQFVELFENPRIRDLWDFNDVYEHACQALQRPMKDIG